MFYLYPSYVAWNYYLLVAAVTLVIIQIAASRSRLRGLLIGGRPIAPTASAPILALATIVATWLFVWRSPDLLSPGLAGSELMLVFGAGALTAVVASLAGSMLRHRPRVTSEAADRAREYALPVAGYTYRLWEGANQDGRMAIVLSDPDLPESAMLPLCQAASAAGLTCYLVGWGREGVPRYPDALAAVPMCIASHGVESPRVLVLGSGTAGGLAMRAAADDDRIEHVLAVGPALDANSLVTGMALLAEMHIADAWRWQHAWDRRSFLASLQAPEALARLGGRARLLFSADDSLFRPPLWLSTIAAQEARVRIVSGVTHRSLVEGEAVGWLGSMLAGAEEVGDVRSG